MISLDIDPEEESLYDPNRLHLLAIKIESPTEVRLVFSASPVINPEKAAEAFEIVDSEGSPIRLKSMGIYQNEAGIVTEALKGGELYEVRVKEPLFGSPDLPLSQINRSVTFEYGEAALQMPLEPTPLPDPTKPRDIINLRLVAVPQEDGSFTVTATWEYNNKPGDFSSYIIRQSMDSGITFTEPQIIQQEVAGIELKGVYPGEFGLAINVANTAGRVSPGVFETLTLPAGATSPISHGPPEFERIPPPVKLQGDTLGPTPEKQPAVTEVIRMPEVRGTDLVGTGASAAIIALIATSGMLGGMRLFGKRKKRAF